ncbi:MAG: hypothetical protein ACFFD4_23095 [Candidatus Odinarchaeota archaeon]
MSYLEQLVEEFYRFEGYLVHKKVTSPIEPWKGDIDLVCIKNDEITWCEITPIKPKSMTKDLTTIIEKMKDSKLLKEFYGITDYKKVIWVWETNEKTIRDVENGHGIEIKELIELPRKIWSFIKQKTDHNDKTSWSDPAMPMTSALGLFMDALKKKRFIVSSE